MLVDFRTAGIEVVKSIRDVQVCGLRFIRKDGVTGQAPTFQYIWIERSAFL